MQECDETDCAAEGLRGGSMREGLDAEPEKLGYFAGTLGICCLVSFTVVKVFYFDVKFNVVNSFLLSTFLGLCYTRPYGDANTITPQGIIIIFQFHN